jgi:hypothetical protein
VPQTAGGVLAREVVQISRNISLIFLRGERTMLRKVEGEDVYYNFTKICFDMKPKFQNISSGEEQRSRLFLSNVILTKLPEKLRLQT